MGEPVIAVRGLGACAGAARILEDVSFDVEAGEVVTLFGPSGAGKTTIAMAVAGLSRPGVTVTGEITAPARVGYLPQDGPGTLNPARRIGRALGELVALRHPKQAKAERRARVAEVLRAVAFDEDPDGILRRYPHQFSGGQRTRLALAQILATEPGAIVLDEPATGLDTLARAAVTDRLAALAGTGVAILLVTHDPVVVERMDSRALHVHDGTAGPMDPPARRPVVRLRESTPSGGEALARLENVSVRYGRTAALHDVSLAVSGGETVGIVGASGAGKSTIARCFAGLVRPARGVALADGVPLLPLRKRNAAQLAAVQYVWQEAASSFDPRRTVCAQVAATGIRLRGLGSRDAKAEALDLLAELGLTAAQANRYPPGLSGGQLRRAALARALLARPRILVCDEVTTGLDHPLSARILDHIDGYRERTGAAVLQISHDLRTLLGRADRIVALDHGRVVETTTPRALLSGAATGLTGLLEADHLGDPS
ncbi:ABC transporter ATP-binding protein [Amycolatopsis acidicola]|uniref:ABC transporter ATP-binding protein n=1 Tax=Amycolatopsis acidicola TaxID=2596893 RepID=A0A5N0UQC1_9PSEU|nr:ATP-binding cassette domain-containing protein [Amycolatopsis acidicola]KAA9149441.1 ABC transporter ATP-binding protein [Amycolatopsis acidicola]